jgi:hypothetical protein
VKFKIARTLGCHRPQGRATLVIASRRPISMGIATSAADLKFLLQRGKLVQELQIEKRH